MIEDVLFKYLSETNANGQVILDPDKKIQYANTAFCSLLGLDPDKIKDKSIASFEQDGTIRVLYQSSDSVATALLKKEPAADKAIIQSSTGRFNIRREAVPWYDKEGELSSIFVQYSDMTGIVRQLDDAKLYRAMFDKSQVAQVVLDKNFTILDLNDTFCTIVGYSRERLMKMDFRDFKGKRMLEYLYDEGQSIDDAIQTKKPVTAHTAWIASNGTHIVDRMIIPFYDEEGELSRWYITYNETTEIENRLEEVSLYHALFEKSQVAQVVLDEEFRILDLNDAFCTIVAYPRERLMKMDFRDFKGKRMLEYLFDRGQGIADALELKKPVTAHAAWIASNGTHIVDRYVIPFYDKKGNLKRWYIIYNEVTELENRIQEARLFQSLFENNHVAQVILDPNLQILHANNAFCSLVGMPMDTLLTMSFRDFREKNLLTYKSDTGSTITDAIAEKKMKKGESTFVSSTGTHVVERYNIPFFNTDGELKNLFIIYNDITEISALMESIRENEKRLSQSAQEVSECLSAIAKGDLTKVP
ncbi:MAG: PAS domain-containing protein, partial [Methanospirillaceae archaeon]|nr:PAS domain-containing protein [Methanospirillaceae archaeon]